MILKIDVNGLVIFFNCKVNITADDRNVYIGFYPLLTDLELIFTFWIKGLKHTITPLTYHTYISTHLTPTHIFWTLKIIIID
jgi:hypothetical protein